LGKWESAAADSITQAQETPSLMTENEVRELIIAKLKLVGATGVLEDKDPLATVRALVQVLTGTDPQKLPNPKVDYNFTPPRLPQEFIHLLEGWGITATVSPSGVVSYSLK
jgi:hypothetical protein